MSVDRYEIPTPTTEVGQQILDAAIKSAGGYAGLPVADFMDHLIVAIVDRAAEAIESTTPQQKETDMPATTITVDGVSYTRSDIVQLPDTTLQIVVVEGGWVFVGDVEKLDDGTAAIRNARNIRRWGTTSGLGQLAGGPTDDTVIDPVSGDRVVIVPLNRIRLTIPCAEGSWLS